MSPNDPDLDGLLKTLATPDFERKIPYMYCDSGGNVTVGIGHNLTADTEFKKSFATLPFRINSDTDEETKEKPRIHRHRLRNGHTGTPLPPKRRPGALALPEEIKNDFMFLTADSGKGRSEGHGLKQYCNADLSILKKYTTVELSEDEIWNLFWKDCDRAKAALRGNHMFGADFDTFPAEGRAALIDMTFNEGEHGFRARFRTTVIAAIKGEGIYAKMTIRDRWESAAKLCNRGLASNRDATVSGWFRSASKTFPPPIPHPIGQ